MTVYLGLFAECKEGHPLIGNHAKDYWNGFDDLSDELKEEIINLDIIVAFYTYECYSGYAFVLYRKDGKLYEVNAYHCSCYGLRDWEPEETSKDALLKRNWEHYSEELKKVFEELPNE